MLFRSGLITETPAAGTIFPQPWIVEEEGRRVRFDALAGHGWRLVLDAERAPPSPDTPDWIRVMRVGQGGLVEADGVLRGWFGRHGVWAALVRPDHYVYATFGEAGILTRELKGLRDRLTS